MYQTCTDIWIYFEIYIYICMYIYMDIYIHLHIFICTLTYSKSMDTYVHIWYIRTYLTYISSNQNNHTIWIYRRLGEGGFGVVVHCVKISTVCIYIYTYTYIYRYRYVYIYIPTRTYLTYSKWSIATWLYFSFKFFFNSLYCAVFLNGRKIL
jgi:hypothetical protein